MSTKASSPFNGPMQPGRRSRGAGVLRFLRIDVRDDRAPRFDDALHLIEHGHWQPAFACLAALADTGHPQAARIAMVFVRRGASMFGGHYPASARQLETWQRAAG